VARRARLRLEPSGPVPLPPPEPDLRFRLTDREREVIALVAEGNSKGEIATALFISPKTASVHVSNILAKLGVSTRTEAATVAHRTGLLSSSDFLLKLCYGMVSLSVWERSRTLRKCLGYRHPPMPVWCSRAFSRRRPWWSLYRPMPRPPAAR
jgi:DNA-binding CsgD family transcriptional regulator